MECNLFLAKPPIQRLPTSWPHRTSWPLASTFPFCGRSFPKSQALVGIGQQLRCYFNSRMNRSAVLLQIRASSGLLFFIFLTILSVRDIASSRSLSPRTTHNGNLPRLATSPFVREPARITKSVQAMKGLCVAYLLGGKSYLAMRSWRLLKVLITSAGIWGARSVVSPGSLTMS